jgi:chitinase
MAMTLPRHLHSLPAVVLLAALVMASTSARPAAAQAPPVDPPALSVADVTVAEGASGATVASFVVGLSRPAPGPVTVRYATLDGTALVADRDYGAVSGTLTIDAGAAAATVDVPVQGDVVEEADELFFLVLSQPQGATLADDRAEAEIVDDDGAAAPGAGPTVSIRDAQVSEGHGGRTRVQLEVELSEPAAVPVTVEYATADASAVAGEDYVAASGRVRIPARATSRRVQVTILGDSLEEGDEELAVGLANPVGAELGQDVGVVSILDDDGAGALTLDVVGSPERRGRPGRTVVLQVRLRNTAGGPVAGAPVAWTVDGDATLLDGPTTVTGRGGVATQRVRLGTGSGRLAVRAEDATHTEAAMFQIAVSAPPG